MWGIAINRKENIYLNNKLRALLPYQTRHFRHKTNELFVSNLEELRRAEAKPRVEQ
ncbi:hypothetical protein LRP52_24040 [Photobacterium sp. ZSDE20]|uniref:Uncharacterized protein n=1 Tax=Photobacterium pectinilyticum TaxID=2906793 RepID=A0ABT1N0V5_9GAMM|nr:hypothetical protein [Photobacterium sp. ZSDE20]MCQ1058371.1 hypothetical protein [Photobacterium sp. ZSDE20]MDD1825266.1 hypothetical protein [Photobacterium sp. ZSDE20]